MRQYEAALGKEAIKSAAASESSATLRPVLRTPPIRASTVHSTSAPKTGSGMVKPKVVGKLHRRRERRREERQQEQVRQEAGAAAGDLPGHLSEQRARLLAIRPFDFGRHPAAGERGRVQERAASARDDVQQPVTPQALIVVNVTGEDEMALGVEVEPECLHHGRARAARAGEAVDRIGQHQPRVRVGVRLVPIQHEALLPGVDVAKLPIDPVEVQALGERQHEVARVLDGDVAEQRERAGFSTLPPRTNSRAHSA